MTRCPYCILLAPMVLVAVAGAPPARAEFEDDPFSLPLEQLEQMIVTARKREEALQEVPVAVTAFDEQALAEFGFNHIIDVADVVPNLNISTVWAASNPFISLRGLGNGGDFNPNIDSAVAVYIDEVFLQAPAGRLGQMFDLAQVEVLRGPQGTLYGKNTTGGTINMASRKPGDEFEANVELTGGNYDLWSFQGGVSIPLIEDTLTARFAIVSNARDGTAKNLYDGAPLNDIDNQAGRAVFVLTPSDSLSATLTAHRFENDSKQHVGKGQVLLNEDGEIERRPDGQIDLTNAVQDAGGFNGFADDPDHYRLNVNNEGYEDVETWGASLIVVNDWERFSLTSVTGYNDTERDLFIDFDYSPNDIGENANSDRAHSFSQEVRLSYDNGKNLAAIGGLYYFDGNTKTDARFGWFNATFPRVQHKQKTESYAVFTQATYDLNDKWSISPGIRYTDEKKDFRMRSDFLVEQLVPETFGPNVGIASTVIPPTRDDQSWSKVSGKLSVDYQLDDDVLLYLSWSRGFKSGGYRLPTTRPDLAGTTVDPEELDAWEFGIKSSWFERKMQANLSAFYYDSQDLHVFSLNSSDIGADFVVNNAESATLYGAELELTATPAAGLELMLNVGWLPEAEYDEFIFDPGGAAEDLSGDRMQFTPKYDISAVAQYRWPIGDRSTLRGRVEWSRQGSSYSSPFEQDRLQVPSYSLTHAALTYALDDRYEVEAWVRNLTDEDHRTLYIDIEGFGFDMVTFTDPRTWGVTLRAFL